MYYCIDNISEMLDEVPLLLIAFIVANRLLSCSHRELLTTRV